MRTAHPAYQGKWPRVRLEILERDGYLCQIGDVGCTVKATTVDHIIDVLSGGAWWDEDNLRAACDPCNQRRRKHKGSRRWMSATTYITLVTGPPDADLLTYVRTHSQPSDLIVDHTALTRSLGSSTAATTARNNLLNQLRQGTIRTPRAWITSSNPRATTTLPHHRVITIPTRGHPSRGGTKQGSVGHGSDAAADAWLAAVAGTSTKPDASSRAW